MDFIKVNGKATFPDLSLKEGESKTIIFYDEGVGDTNFSFKVDLAKDASLKIYNVVTSSNKVTIDERVDLNGSFASVTMMNVLLTNKNAVLNNKTFIYHNVENTMSDFSSYAIAKDDSFMTLDNNAKIVAGASKSVCHQKAKGLTMDKTSRIKAQPNLFIDEYDVVANHAAAIGSINKEDLFYMMSRGLTLAEASKLIVLGFVQPLLDSIDDEDVKKEISDNFINKL